MSNLTRIPPDLLSMPNEILTEICSHAHDGDDIESRGKEWLRAVRLTCKRLNVLATVEFGKRFLATIPVMAARCSLQLLVDICKHPLIGPQVSKVQLLGRRPSKNRVRSWNEQLGTCFCDGDLQGFQEAKRSLQLILDLMEESLELENYEGAFPCLHVALHSIRSYGNSIALSVSNEVRIKPFGHMEALGSQPEDSQDTFADIFDLDCVKPSLAILLVAAARSGCAVHQIELDIDESEYELLDCYSWHWEPAFREDVLSAVRVVHLSMTPYLFVVELEEMMKLLFQHMEKLIELSLRTKYNYQERIQHADINGMDAMLQSIQCRYLRTIDLREGLCRQKDVISLLDRNEDTLRILRISEYTLLGSWEVVLMWIKEHCPLASLSISRLSEFDNDTGHEFWGPNAVTWTEQDFHGESADLDGFLKQRQKKQAGLVGEKLM